MLSLKPRKQGRRYGWQSWKWMLPTLLLMMISLPMKGEDTRQGERNPRFRTLRVSNPDNFMAPPVMRLGTDDRIEISFDEIGDDRSWLRYRLIHCNADWQPSRMQDSEITDGFNEAPVDDYAFSSNTFIHYVNYRIEIPNDDMSPLISGNYLLQVYPEDDPDDILLQARFYVAEPLVRVEGEVSPRTDRGFHDRWQQADIILDTSHFRVRDPFNDFIVVTEQNRDPSVSSSVEHPQRVSGDKVIYQHVPSLIFPASNEFRRFETVRADYPGMHVDSTRYIGSNYHAFLTPDLPRASKGYEYDRTQYGRFLIREYNATDSDLGADYVTVHFTLVTPPMADCDIYVDGDFSSHQRDSRYRMTYDSQSGAYTLQLPLKQGSYNYRYVAVGKTDGKEDYSRIDGDKYETSNEYMIRVYERLPGARADRLVGFATFL